jgi:hypothetical protein
MDRCCLGVDIECRGARLTGNPLPELVEAKQPAAYDACRLGAVIKSHRGAAIPWLDLELAHDPGEHVYPTWIIQFAWVARKGC